MEKMIKLSAVFKVVDGEDDMLVENVMTFDAEKASEKGMTKLELYSFLKEVTIEQVKKVSEEAEVLDASAGEAKEYHEQK